MTTTLPPSLGRDALEQLVELMVAPAAGLPVRLSALVSPHLEHSAVLVLAADATGGQRQGSGDPAFVDGVSFLELDQLRRTVLSPGQTRRSPLAAAGRRRSTFQALSRNGALLLLAEPGPPDRDEFVGQLWNLVALRVQSLADAASPAYLQLARAASGVRMEALTELADEYSTTLESVLAPLRSARLDDRAARQAATGIAAQGLVQLRTASDRVRTFTEEPVTTAFERLRDDLRPLMQYRDITVQFVAPPVDGRPLPSEVAHGARAVVRGSILAMIGMTDVRRVRVKWDCDGTNLLINMRDDGTGDIGEAGIELQLLRRRIQALSGRFSVEATPGWGTEVTIAIPLDPPTAVAPTNFDLSPRELEVLEQLVVGRRNRVIAAELHISENTVKFHISQILRKLGAASRAEAVAMALATHTAGNG